MAALPSDMERCLQRHTGHIVQTMRNPDGVFIFLSGAKLLDQPDLDDYRSLASDDVPGKNHALIRIISNKGRKGFETFLDALDFTEHKDLADKIRTTLYRERTTRGKNDNEIVSTPHTPSSLPSTSRVQSVSCSQSWPASSRSPVVATPVTPPLTEAEFRDHIYRLTNLLHDISSTHADRRIRREAEDLEGEINDQGASMLHRVAQLSQENTEKEQELRRAKYMVRGMEQEIKELRASQTTPQSPQPGSGHGTHPPGNDFKTTSVGPGRVSKSKIQKSGVCGIL